MFFNTKSTKPTSVKSCQANNSFVSQFTFQNYNVTYVSLDNQYNINPAVNRVVGVIADAVANLPPIIIDEESKAILRKHPFWETLKRPNEEQIWREYITDCISDYMLDGTTYSYLGSGSARKEVDYIRRVRPENVTIQINAKNGNPKYYDVLGYGSTQRYNYYPYDDKRSQILKISQYDSKSQYFGELPSAKLKSAYDEIQHLELASKYNLSFLKKGARPSMALVSNAKNGYDGQLTEEQVTALKKQIKENYGGSNNAGEIMVLSGGLDVKPMSLNMKDMDFKELMEFSLILVCMVAGVPPEMCGVTKAKTYNSAEEAKISFFDNTIIPLANHFYEKLNSWIMYRYSPAVYNKGGKFKNAILTYDKGSIDALEKRRFEVSKTYRETGATTINERRARLNLDPVKDGDIPIMSVGEMPYNQQTNNATPVNNNGGKDVNKSS